MDNEFIIWAILQCYYYIVIYFVAHIILTLAIENTFKLAPMSF